MHPASRIPLCASRRVHPAFRLVHRAPWQMRNGTRAMAFALRPLRRVKWQVHSVLSDLQLAKWPVAPVKCGAYRGLWMPHRVICLTATR